MNQRIQDLIAEAQIKFEAHPHHPFVDTAVVVLADMEKLAELIVRECAEYAEHNLDMAGYKKKFMLKRFGVEE